LGSTALAQKLDMTPGLWEFSFKMSSSDPTMDQAMQEMQKQLASLPPEQRKMMEDMFAAQGVGLGANGTTIKVCMTQEQIEQGQLPQQDQDKNCTHEMNKVGKNEYKMTFACKGNPPSSGSGEMKFSDSKHYTGTSTIITESNGKKDVMNVSQAGTWLSMDCGKIKPITR
jgi:hypothetical protein